MIARLRGQVLEIGEDSLVIDVGGVGYLVQASPRLLRDLPTAGGSVDLVVETLVRDDAITLIGFESAAEKRLFRLLQSIQGVGTRLALAILGVLDPTAFTRAVVSGDRAALTSAPGVGPRLAQRILSELKERIGSLPAAASAPATAGVAALGPSDDALSALVQLGYGRSEAFDAVGRAIGEVGDEGDVGAVVRRALQLLGQRHG
ncbi:MAG: Holliday junction branch migration protein RuvA [Pseudomonadota bacterium]